MIGYLYRAKAYLHIASDAETACTYLPKAELSVKAQLLILGRKDILVTLTFK